MSNISKRDEVLAKCREFSGDGLSHCYNAIFHRRNMKIPPHLYPVCNALMDERIKKLGIIIGPGAGKSSLLSILYPAVKLGHSPGHTILGISAAESLVQGFMRSTAEIIEYSAEYHEIFPGTKPDKGSGWSSERGYSVTGHDPGNPDASYWGAGLDSSTLTGKHAMTLILDDIHNQENSGTSAACRKVNDRYYNTIIGRADPAGARFILAGRRWSEDDIYGRLMRDGDHEWVFMTLPAERHGTNQLWWDIQVPDGLICCFTEGLQSAEARVRGLR